MREVSSLLQAAQHAYKDASSDGMDVSVCLKFK